MLQIKKNYVNAVVVVEPNNPVFEQKNQNIEIFLVSLHENGKIAS